MSDDSIQTKAAHIHEKLKLCSLELMAEGYTPMEINSCMLGTARRSMSAIVGEKEANLLDKACRKSIGWE